MNEERWGRHSCLPRADVLIGPKDCRLRRQGDKNVCPTRRQLSDADKPIIDYHAPGGATSGAPTLARHIGLFALVVYGVGDMVGAGIYATLGRAAGKMGHAMWIAFL